MELRGPALLWTAASLLLFAVVEAAIFRSGWYNRFLEPESTAGRVESSLHWLSTTRPGAVPEILVVGDSRVAEGFSSRLASAAAGGGATFWNFGISGTTARDWYYIVRDADPGRRRFSKIAFAMDHYADEDPYDPLDNRLIDLNFVVTRLSLADCPGFAWSMGVPASRLKAFTGCLFRGVALRRDVQAFLADIPDRLRRVRDWRDHGFGYIEGYSGSSRDLQGLSVDFATRTIHFPPGLTQPRHDSLLLTLTPKPAPQTGGLTRYRELWLGRILDLYRNSPSEIVFLEMPRAPLPLPPASRGSEALDWLLRHPRTSALPATTFRDLERPDLFMDGLHLNKAGREVFSQRLGTLLTADRDAR